MKGAAAALRAGDLVRVCERLERIAKRLPDQHESDATPRALVADVAAKIRALAADAAELRRVSTFPVAHAATRHGEALATKLGALVLVAARAFRLSVEVRAEMETVRSRGDDARVGSARRVSETRRRLFSETRARRRSLDDGARNDFLATFAAARALRDTERDAEATGARELALAARELWREIRDAAASSWRVNALKLAAFQRALEAFAWDAWVVLGSAMPDVERALGSGESSKELSKGIGNIGNIGNVGIGALGARVRATRDGETRVPRGSRGTRGGGRDGGEMESRVGSQTRERIREFRRAETELPRVDVVSISAGRLYAVKCTAAVADADAKDRDGRRDEDDDDDDDDGYGKPNDGRRRALRFTRWIR